MNKKLTVQDLIDTFDAFNRHDIDAVMKCFADDCIFYAVAGDEVFGTKIEGKQAITTAFSDVWAGIKDANWAHHSHFIMGNRAVSEWTFSGTMSDGKYIEAEGADLFTLRDGKIIIKQAFRKSRPLLDAKPV